jgi:hypothetical protein
MAFLIILAYRVPFLTQPLVGEEGSHAMLLKGYSNKITENVDDFYHSGNFRKDCLLVIARVESTYYVTGPSRTIVPYCFVEKVIGPMFRFVDPWARTFDQKSAFARLAYLMICGIGMLSLLYVSYQAAQKGTFTILLINILVVVYFLTTPIAVGGSIQPQLDGSIGVAIMGLMLVLLFKANASYDKKYRMLLSCIAGVLVCFCKNEWPLALLAALFAIYMLIKLRSIFYKQDTLHLEKYQVPFQEMALGLILGLIVGVFICWALAPQDYLDGFQLMRTIRSEHFSVVKLISIQFPLIYPLGFAIIGAIVAHGLSLRTPTNIVRSILLLFAGIISAGFLSSGWLGDYFPRYFIPSIIMLTGCIVLALPSIMKKVHLSIRVGCIAILLSGILLNTYTLAKRAVHNVSITSQPGLYNPLTKEIIQEASSMAAVGDIRRTHSSVAYYTDDTDFVSNALSPDVVTKLLSKTGHAGLNVLE